VVVVPPSIDGGDTTETVIEILENKEAYLSCPAIGVPQPSITWYRNGTPMQVEWSIFGVMRIRMMHMHACNQQCLCIALI